jgi:hypothetical protein
MTGPDGHSGWTATGPVDHLQRLLMRCALALLLLTTSQRHSVIIALYSGAGATFQKGRNT